MVWENLYKERGKQAWGLEPGAVKTLKKLISKGKVLDVGCGTGRASIFLAENGFDVTGVDISKEAIGIARKWTKKEKLKIKLKVMDASNLKFVSNSFDAIFSNATIHHLLKREKAINEIYRVLKPNGIALITVFSTKDPGLKRGIEVEKNTLKKLSGVLVHYFEENEIKNLFKKFKILSLKHRRNLDKSHGKPHYHCVWKIVAKKSNN